MAKARPPVQRPITPTTKGARVPKRAMPFTAPLPRAGTSSTGGHDPESAAFSQVGLVGSTRARRTPEQLARAQARITGEALPDDEELDALGADDAPQDEGDSEDDGETEPEGTDGDDIRISRAELEQLLANISAGKQAPAIAPKQETARAPQNLERTLAPGLELSTLGDKDTDRLWDWIRQDGDLGVSFLGAPFPHYMALHAVIEGLRSAEVQSGSAMLRALVYVDEAQHAEHIGFLLFAPIFSAEKLALVHIYLSPRWRGQLAAITPAILPWAEHLLPGYKLAIYSATEALARLHRQILTPLGFTAHLMFVREGS